MTLDISLEAIEADLAIAERGGQVASLAMARAQVRATLLAAWPVDPMVAADGHSLAIEAEHQGRHEAPTMAIPMAPLGPDIQIAQGDVVNVFTVPSGAAWEDRVTAAAILLGIEEGSLRIALQRIGLNDNGVPVILQALQDVPSEEDARAGEPEEEPPVEDDVDADFFAEAKKARKRK